LKPFIVSSHASGILIVGLASLALAFTPSPAAATWFANGDSISVWPCGALPNAAISDSAGGVFIVWTDDRTCVNAQVYDQHVLADGGVAAGWPVDGLAIAPTTTSEGSAHAVADGAGGLIVAWTDTRTGRQDIFAQRIAPNSGSRWSYGGVRVCTAGGVEGSIAIAPDGNHGAYITWRDGRRGLNDGPPYHHALYDLYAQRLDAQGIRQWPESGLGIETRAGVYSDAPMVTDGGSGVFLVWEDDRGTGMYMQHLDPEGSAHLAPDGVGIPGGFSLLFVPDGAGGMISTYTAGPDGAVDIYAQRVDSTGASEWTNPGVPLVNAINNQEPTSILEDGEGGAYIAWHDVRYQNYDVYLLRIGADGTRSPGWPFNGLPLATQPNSQIYPQMISDGAGGCIVSWYDNRDDSTAYDIYAKRVRPDGYSWPGWPYGGVALCRAPGDQKEPLLAPDGTGGAFVAWGDYRSYASVYANHVDGAGNVSDSIEVAVPPPPPPPPLPALALAPPEPNPLF